MEKLPETATLKPTVLFPFCFQLDSNIPLVNYTILSHHQKRRYIVDWMQ